jgi:hypothetical protein
MLKSGFFNLKPFQVNKADHFPAFRSIFFVTLSAVEALLQTKKEYLLQMKFIELQ